MFKLKSFSTRLAPLLLMTPLILSSVPAAAEGLSPQESARLDAIDLPNRPSLTPHLRAIWDTRIQHGVVSGKIQGCTHDGLKTSAVVTYRSDANSITAVFQQDRQGLYDSLDSKTDGLTSYFSQMMSGLNSDDLNSGPVLKSIEKELSQLQMPSDLLRTDVNLSHFKVTGEKCQINEAHLMM